MNENFRPLKRPKQKRSLETFNSILQAALIVLEGEGFDAFNTNRVAEKAGVSISSLYQYFPNKESILGELIIDFITTQDKTVISKVDNLQAKANFRDTLYCLISSLVDFNTENAKMCEIIYQNVGIVGRDKDVSEIDTGTLNLLKEIFIRFKKEVRDQDVDILLRTIFHSIRGVNSSIHTRINKAAYDSDTLKKELTYLAYRYLT
jgi:AcrR family transcriptional regulator